MIEITKKFFIFKVREIWWPNRNKIREIVNKSNYKNQDVLIFKYLKENLNKELNTFNCYKEKTIIIDLRDNLETIWKNLDKSSCRWAIKKALKEGIKIHYNEHYKEFIKIYKEFCKKKKITPSFGISEKFLKKYGLLLTAEYNNQIISGAFFIYDKNNIRYTIGASRRLDANNRLKKVIGYANRLLIWEAIKWGKNKELKTFDLGGYYGGKEDKEKMNIDRFKKSFGGKIVEYYSYEKVLSLKYKISRFIYRNFQKLNII